MWRGLSTTDQHDNRRPPERDPEAYWQEDVSIGALEFQERSYQLWMRLHRSQGTYREHRELMPLAETSGERLYLHAKLYILIPGLRLTVALDDPSRPSNGNGQKPPGARQIGRVLSAERAGSRQVAQADYPLHLPKLRAISVTKQGAASIVGHA